MEAYWYFDFASPFSYLQLTKVREWRARMPVTPVPIIARALPKAVADSEALAISSDGSVERFVRWRAKAAGIPLTFPRSYPFNSSAALRLCVAAGSSWHAIETIFAHLWGEGREGTLAEDLRSVGLALGIQDPIRALGSSDTVATLLSRPVTKILSLVGSWSSSAFELLTAVVTAALTADGLASPVPRVTEPLRAPSRAACCSAV